MTATCLGSAGAARVMRAAERWWQRGRSWRWGEHKLVCRRSRHSGRVEWRLYGIDVSRAEARILLRGLLAPQVAAELVEWMEANAFNATLRRAREGLPAGTITRVVDAFDVLAKLRDLGVADEEGR